MMIVYWLQQSTGKRGYDRFLEVSIVYEMIEKLEIREHHCRTKGLGEDRARFLTPSYIISDESPGLNSQRRQ
jgi:hypothetical protein